VENKGKFLIDNTTYAFSCTEQYGAYQQGDEGQEFMKSGLALEQNGY